VADNSSKGGDKLVLVGASNFGEGWDLDFLDNWGGFFRHGFLDEKEGRRESEKKREGGGGREREREREREISNGVQQDKHSNSLIATPFPLLREICQRARAGIKGRRN
jgi:hypothetical protein